MRHYSEAEYTRVEGQALSARRLAQLWKELPEGERFAFVLSLEEKLADQVIELTAPATAPAGREPTNDL